jgi:hypothetical protein
LAKNSRGKPKVFKPYDLPVSKYCANGTRFRQFQHHHHFGQPTSFGTDAGFNRLIGMEEKMLNCARAGG